jgi:hypothetical protein
MGMFSDLMNRIFRSGTASPAAVPDPASGPAVHGPATTAPAAGSTAGAPTAAAAAQPMQPVDVAAILDKMAKENNQKLDWRHSIVDLMKLVGMDSSLAARRELAGDLHYAGDTKDTAAMNIWLHKEVMKKLAENGGKVPPDLLAA